MSPVKQLALSRGIRVVQPDSLRDTGVLEQLTDFAPEFIVVAALGQILPQEMLAVPGFGCLNIHPSLLPKYRGSSPVAAAILEGEEITGVTIMLMDVGLDSGPILSQREVPVSAEDTTGSLTARLAQAGAQLLMETLPLWLEGEIKPQPQEENNASFTKSIDKGDGEIDWNFSALELWRRVRAFDPWPRCYTWWHGKRLKLNSVMPLDAEKSGEAGKVIALPQTSPVSVGVKTGNGVLGLLQVQLEGKKEVSAEEFARGQRDFVGSYLL